MHSKGWPASQDVAGSCKGSALLQTFTDGPYNRTSYTLAARTPLLVCCLGQQQLWQAVAGLCTRCRQPAQLAGAVAALARHALAVLDFRQHTASHPRLGTVDHISCHPLGCKDLGALQEAASAAQQIGEPWPMSALQPSEGSITL